MFFVDIKTAAVASAANHMLNARSRLRGHMDEGSGIYIKADRLPNITCINNSLHKTHKIAANIAVTIANLVGILNIYPSITC